MIDDYSEYYNNYTKFFHSAESKQGFSHFSFEKMGTDNYERAVNSNVDAFPSFELISIDDHDTCLEKRIFVCSIFSRQCSANE